MAAKMKGGGEGGLVAEWDLSGTYVLRIQLHLLPQTPQKHKADKLRQTTHPHPAALQATNNYQLKLNTTHQIKSCMHADQSSRLGCVSLRGIKGIVSNWLNFKSTILTATFKPLFDICGKNLDEIWPNTVRSSLTSNMPKPLR